MSTKMTEQEFQEAQGALISTLQTRLRRSVLKTMTEHLVDHHEDFGLFIAVTLRALLHEAARLTAVLVSGSVTGEEGKLRLRAVMEGLTLLEQSEMGEVLVAVRKLFVSELTEIVKRTKATEKPEELTQDIREALLDAVMSDDD